MEPFDVFYSSGGAVAAVVAHVLRATQDSQRWHVKAIVSCLYLHWTHAAVNYVCVCVCVFSINAIHYLHIRLLLKICSRRPKE